MQPIPPKNIFEEALKKAKPKAVAPQQQGRSPEAQKIHEIFVNTFMPADVFEKTPAKTTETKSTEKKTKTQRDLQAELRELNLVPPDNQGPKRGVGQLHSMNQQIPGVYPGMPGMPGMIPRPYPGMPGGPMPQPMPRPMPFNHNNLQKNTGEPADFDPNNYDDFQIANDNNYNYATFNNNEEEEEKNEDGNNENENNEEEKNQDV